MLIRGWWAIGSQRQSIASRAVAVNGHHEYRVALLGYLMLTTSSMRNADIVITNVGTLA